MADDRSSHRSRRSLLAAAAGGAAALAAQAALPLTAAAADPNDIAMGVANHSTATTTLINDTDDSTVFAVTSNAFGTALQATGDTGVGVHAWSGLTAGVYAISVSNGGAADFTETVYTGVYGWAPADAVNGLATGVWGDSDDFGVYGTGYFGVYGSGYNGVYGTGVVGVTGQAEGTVGPGVRAKGMTSSSLALQVIGKVSFNRSGRKQIGAGKSSVVVSLAGVTSQSKIFAVLASNRSGRYVRAVVSGTNQFTIYLNASYTSASYIAWFVLD
jgi:hypothetical protein